MAIRIIRTGSDPVLRKKTFPVKKITPKIKEILDDMAETMLDANGLGLAAPQVGISKSLVVINLTPINRDRENEDPQDSGEKPPEILYLINPEIVKEEGEALVLEGCLSFPGIWGEVLRPEKVVAEALDRDGKAVRITGEGLLAQALRHEVDHLEGEVFIDKVERFVDLDEQADNQEEGS